MIVKRPSGDRGHFDHGWLETYHTFSFGRYHDPRYIGFRDLLVINEDRVRPGRGFGAHSHADMEILTYVVEGVLAHRDSMGNETRIEAGEVQRMSAGTGVTHSEFNPSREAVHFLQIWLTPDEDGLEPSYEQRRVRTDDTRGTLRVIVAPGNGDGAVAVHQDARVLLGLLDEGNVVVHQPLGGRHAWVQVISGEVALNDVALAPGDGAAVSDEQDVRIRAISDAHFLLFDLA